MTDDEPIETTNKVIDLMAALKESLRLRHHRYECQINHSGERCHYCDGNLFLCTVCGGAESSLTTDCPGTPLTKEQDAAVSAGTLDYKYGKWVHQDNQAVIGVEDRLDPTVIFARDGDQVEAILDSLPYDKCRLTVCINNSVVLQIDNIDKDLGSLTW